MKSVGYIIDDGFDEIEHLKMTHNKFKYSEKKIFGLTIAPTLDCNFGCAYCFEDRKQKTISSIVEEKIYELVLNKALAGKGILITWFGGEPMLEFNTIIRMTERFKSICDENNVSYDAGMVTNGYLFDKSKIEKLKNLSINSIQITLDGSRNIHDKRRHLLNGGPTFDTIIENIKHLVDAKQNVTIRVNVDKRNNDNVDDLLEYLDSVGLNSVSVGLGHVKVVNKSLKSLEKECLSKEEYSKKNRDLIDSTKKYKLKSGTFYPKNRPVYCAANTTHSYVVDPEGYLCKCWNDIGIEDRRIGSLFSPTTSEQGSVYNKYVLFSPFDDAECIKCKFLPVCMGGCLMHVIFDGFKSCESWKFGFEENIIATYNKVSNKNTN